ncbi:Ribonucleotide reductase of class II (coenzyme B12-dependent)2C alpha subunit [gamma proteobacterium IMCC2047]|nr:Ribonucleotide reductase of class II (coenzyme B12-dependent)2C alpha subunit [gamma proteobacterium IMCC2047]
MATKIDQKIVGYKVINEEEKAQQAEQAAAAAEEQKQNNIIQMHESVERPEMLVGSTNKIKTPDSQHAMYITINDIVLNQGTDHEQRRPFEVFINSKNMDHFQWIVALTRITSAVFRKGGDVTFLVEEMQAVFDPKGGYFKKGGKFMPSLVAEIGGVIEDHLKKIGMIVDEGMHEEQKKILAEKRAEYEAAHQAVTPAASEEGEGQYPPGATVCNKCSTKAVIMMDGCMTCLSCGDSKCG